MRAKAHLITEIRENFLYEEETADLEPCLKIDCCWRQHVTVVTSIFNISFHLKVPFNRELKLAMLLFLSS